MKKAFLLEIIICVIVFALSCSYLVMRHNRNREVAKQAEGYGQSFYTHTGKKVSERNGPLRLCLSPWTIYRNLPNQKTSNFTINSRGFRGKEISGKQEGRKRIIVTGGSTAFGMGSKNDKETFEAIIESSDDKYEVINAGVLGFLSGQELAFIVTELCDYEPDIVISYNGWNDLFDSLYCSRKLRINKDYLGFNNTFFIIEEKLASGYKNSVRHNKKGLENEEALSVKVNTKSEFSSDEEFIETVIRTYTANMIKARDFLSSRNIKFVVVFQPEVGQKSHRTAGEEKLFANRTVFTKDYKEAFPALYSSFIKRSKQILSQNGVDFIDINSDGRFKDNKNQLFQDLVHTNKEGNVVIAEIIRNYLETTYRNQ